MRRHLAPRFWLFVSLALASSAPPASAQWHKDGAPVCTAFSTQAYPVITSDGGGGVIIAWQDLRNPQGYDIYAQHILSSGAPDPAWPLDGRALCTAINDQTNPTITGDGAGGAIVTWEDLRAGSNFDIYAQHVLASGTVDPAWPVNGRALCTAVNDQTFPQIVSDGSGGAIVTWQDVRAGAPNYDIYAQRVLASGAVDPLWPADGQAVCTAANDQEAPMIAGDGAGGAIITWYDGRGADYDIYAQHVRITGVVDPAWPANGCALCTGLSTQLSPTLVSDGAGGAIVTWYDARNGVDYDIYAERVLSTGAVDPAWPLNGRALCTATNNQRLPQIVTDGSGGAIVAWRDDRGVGADIYAQHVRITGVVDPAWPVDGRALCTATNNQILPQIAADGAGGAIVTWEDSRNGVDYDVYAQRVLSTGAVAPTWPVDGKGLCTAANDQTSPMIVGVGVGGAIVTWFDARGAGFDIYAQRVYPTGAVAAVTPPTAPTRLAMLPPHPNPAVGGLVSLGFDLSSGSAVSADVFDLAGHRVRALANGRAFTAGRHTLEWDGRDDLGRRAAAAVYFVRVRQGSEAETQSVVVLR